MKLRQLALLSLAMAFSHSAIAQNHDDIYYDSSKDEEKNVVEEVKDETIIVSVNPDEINQDAMYNYFSDDQTANWHGNIVENRDVDEYNRRDVGLVENSLQADMAGDTISIDPSVLNGDTFQYTERIRRFHDPDIITESDDEELVDLYVYTRPEVNLVIGTPTYYVSPFSAGLYFSSWAYDPWYYDFYYPWYDPWYYRPAWHWSWSWSWNWWGPSWWSPGYHIHHHYHGYPGPSFNHRPATWASSGRRNVGNHNYRPGAGNARPGYASGSHRSGSSIRNQAGIHNNTGHRRAQTFNGSNERRQAISGNNSIRNNRLNTSNNQVRRYIARTNRFKTVGNRMNVSSSATRRPDMAVSGNRLNTSSANGNMMHRRTSSSSTINRGNVTGNRFQTRTNRINRNTSTRYSGTRQTYNGTSQSRFNSTRGSFYRNNNSRVINNQTRSGSFNRNTSRPAYNRGSSFRSAPKSSGVSRGGAMRSSGAGRAGGGHRR